MFINNKAIFKSQLFIETNSYLTVVKMECTIGNEKAVFMV